jgi:3-methylcrotonyl-CoA carboxylase beta subunit
MWPNARIGVMGGEQAASVMAQVTREKKKRQGETWSDEDEKNFKAPLLAQYTKQSSAIYSSARLWDDGVIDPAETRKIVGMSLAISLNSPIRKTEFGIFRM